MNFIKKVFDGKIDEGVHLQFQKFSKGEFRNRAIIESKKTGKGYTIKTSAEFANGLVQIVAEKLGEGSTRVTGAIVSTQDLTGELEFKEKKQFQGVKRYLIDKEMSGIEIIGLLEKFPKNFFALTFAVGDMKLKIKPKAPKSGKPGKEKDSGPKADFCNLKTKDKNLVLDFVFEIPDFKEAKVNHTFFIEEIIMPEFVNSENSEREEENSSNGEEDYAKVREIAKRKGRIVRTAMIDGVEMNKEIEFVA